MRALFLLATTLATAHLRAAAGAEEVQIEVRLSTYLDFSGEGEAHVVELGKEPRTITFNIEETEQFSLKVTPLDDCRVSIEVLRWDNVTMTRPLSWPAFLEPGTTFAVGVHFPRHRQEIRGSVSGIGACSRETR